MTLRVHFANVLQNPGPKPDLVKKRLVCFGGNEVRRGRRIKCPCFWRERVPSYSLKIMRREQCREWWSLVDELDRWVFEGWGFGPGFIDGGRVKRALQFRGGEGL